MTGSGSLEELARAAAEGDSKALHALINEIQDPIYGLALRFLGDPHDAEDAAQEILLRVTTRLATFEGRSQLMTWVYTIATRMLLRTKQGRVEAIVVGPERFAQMLDDGLSDHDPTGDHIVHKELEEEVRLSCTYGMLLCLSRPVRAAYILGDVLGCTDVVGAEICDTTRAAFRQRLARARKTMRAIIEGRCGLVEQANTCRCRQQAESGLSSGLLDPGHLPLANHPRVGDRAAFDTPSFESDAFDSDAFDRAADELDVLVSIGSLYKRDAFAAPAAIWSAIQTALPTLAGPDSS